VTISPLGGGRYEVVTESGRSLAYGTASAGATWVFFEGRVYVVTTAGAPRRHSRHHDGRGTGSANARDRRGASRDCAARRSGPATSSSFSRP
jgi:hypothetical protein